MAVLFYLLYCGAVASDDPIYSVSRFSQEYKIKEQIKDKEYYILDIYFFYTILILQFSNNRVVQGVIRNKPFIEKVRRH